MIKFAKTCKDGILSIPLNQKITTKDLEKILTFISNSLKQKGFQKVIFGLSGGIDSAVVALLCQKILKENILAICMPSKNSNLSNFLDAKHLCEEFNIPYEIHSIAPYEEIFMQENPDALRLGNFYARIRMTLLYDLSQKYNAIVIGTSNKSELMLGYGTIFGDLACALNPIAPFFKTQIFQIAKLLNIPSNIIQKAPSADLYPNQSDEAELGYSYALIDPLLEYITNTYPSLELLPTDSLDNFTQQGFDLKMTQAIITRIKKNLFKSQAPLLFEV